MLGPMGWTELSGGGVIWNRAYRSELCLRPHRPAEHGLSLPAGCHLRGAKSLRNLPSQHSDRQIPQGSSLPEKNQDSPTEEYPSWLGQLGPLADIVRQVEGKLGAPAANALMARLRFVALESL